MEAARARFLRDGVDGASLRGIAQDAGTSIGMIYYYFPTKDDLFVAVVEDVYAGLLEELSRTLDPSAAVEPQLRSVSERLGSLSDKEFEVVRIVVREALVSTDRRAKILQRFSTGHMGMMLGVLVQGMARGEVTDRHPGAVTLFAVGGVMVLPQLLRQLIQEQLPHSLGLFPEPAELAEHLSDILMHGLAASKDE